MQAAARRTHTQSDSGGGGLKVTRGETSLFTGASSFSAKWRSKTKRNEITNKKGSGEVKTQIEKQKKNKERRNNARGKTEENKPKPKIRETRGKHSYRREPQNKKKNETPHIKQQKKRLHVQTQTHTRMHPLAHTCVEKKRAKKRTK